jgi:Kdo2-lipid IVA lauroyltransferase/acyltransferase
MIGRNGGDVLRAYLASDIKYYDRIRRVSGLDVVEGIRASGKSIIFLVAHIGAIEILANEMAMRGFEPNIIGTPLKNKKLNDLLWKHRARFGATPVVRGQETVRLVKVLLSGGAVVILIDQDTKVKSCFVNFFGKPAHTPIGAAMLALRTGAVVIPTFIHMADDLIQEIEFHQPITLINSGEMENDIVSNTQLFTDIIEKQIRKHPEQWVWMHRRWKTKPEINQNQKTN